MSYEEYRRLTGKAPSILDLLAMPGADDVELDLPERRLEPFPEVDFG